MMLGGDFHVYCTRVDFRELPDCKSGWANHFHRKPKPEYSDYIIIAIIAVDNVDNPW
jgi:hypothetical protein